MQIEFEYKHVGKLITVNNMYINGKVLTKDARNFKDALYYSSLPYCRHVFPTDFYESPVEAWLTIKARKKSFDVFDNPKKPVYDALEGLAYKNDRQIFRDHGWRIIDKTMPKNTFIYKIKLLYY